MFNFIVSDCLSIEAKVEETEEEFQKIIESEVNHFLHNTSRFTNVVDLHGKTYEEQLPILFNISQDAKPQDLLNFENKLIDLLQIQHPSFKLLPRTNNRQ
ncbi:MAG: hypothetical protein WCG25_04090 [bacterium]